MAVEFRLPSIGDAHTEAEIREWLVEVGAEVERDQDLLEVETAKATVVIPSPHSGVLLARFGEEGDVVEVGTLLAVIGEDGESWKEGADDSLELMPTSSEPEPEVTEEPDVANQGTRPAESTVDEAGVGGAEGSDVDALPSVRRLARERGLNLDLIAGSGPGGRVLREDVLRAEASTRKQPHAAMQSAMPDDGSRLHLSMRRRTIAANLSRNWREIPHANVYDFAFADELIALRNRIREQTSSSIVVDALVAKLLLPALRDFPDLTSFVDGQEVVRRTNLDLGFAIDSDDGLVVGVVRHVDRKGLAALSEEIRNLAERIRGGRGRLDDVEGAVFTISNLGAAGGGSATTILPDRHSAMLTVGHTRDDVVAVNHEPMVKATMPLSLTFDHRLVDGGQAVRFLARTRELLEAPTAALLLSD